MEAFDGQLANPGESETMVTLSVLSHCHCQQPSLDAVVKYSGSHSEPWTIGHAHSYHTIHTKTSSDHHHHHLRIVLTDRCATP